MTPMPSCRSGACAVSFPFEYLANCLSADSRLADRRSIIHFCPRHFSFYHWKSCYLMLWVKLLLAAVVVVVVAVVAAVVAVVSAAVFRAAFCVPFSCRPP